MDFQKFIDASNAAELRVRSSYHLTLKELIRRLRGHEDLQGDLPVVWDFDFKSGPQSAHSYRGYYSDLAFSSGAPLSVKDLRFYLEEKVLDKIFEGYKGGDFLMDGKTPLWCAEYGLSSGIAIMDVEWTGGFIQLKTKIIEF